MRRLRILALLTAVLLAVPGFGMAQTETPEMRIDISGGEVLPGLAAVITVIAPEDGTCSIGILDADGKQIAVVAADALTHAAQTEVSFVHSRCLFRIETAAIVGHGELQRSVRKFSRDAEVLRLSVVDGVRGKFADDAQGRVQ